ncbi:MAG: phosphopyruvate hydratase [bacterium]|nr:phosphopyruvate hydratase [bacterium]
MFLIERVHAREVFDSRGNPTVEAEVTLQGGITGRAIAPSGASTGAHEAHELRDGGERYHGRGVQGAVDAVIGRIAPAISGMDALDQRAVDQAMIDLDGTPNKSALGANSILAVSLATAWAAAQFSEQPLYRYLGGAGAHVLPVPLLNVINGGAHADNDVDVQEFMLAPYGFETFREAYRAGVEIYQQLKKVVKGHGYTTNVGDEGGFAPALKSNEEALTMLAEAVESSGYSLGSQVAFAMDVAATEFAQGRSYKLASHPDLLSSEELITWYNDIRHKFPIFSIEDPLSEDDWAGWREITSRMGGSCQLVGDDLLCTNPARLSRAIAENSCNAILVKLNQIGTLSETLDVVEQAQRAGMRAVISHRSGETEDVTVAHLVVATNAGQIKSGAPARTDRVAKYNELLRIEEQLGASATFAGADAVRGHMVYPLPGTHGFSQKQSVVR